MANLHVNLAFSADTGKAKAQIQELQTLLSKIAYTGSTTNITGTMQEDLQKASSAAKELQFHLNNAFNTTTGKFDLSLLDKSLKTSGTNISSLSTQLLGAGTTGQQAFAKLAQSISLADQPMLRISKRMQEFAVTMKNTVKWQLSSSMLHGFMGAVQSAYGYAQDLNKSLTDIRIVTGYNTDQMAAFAEQANKAAKSLSTTTTDYTNASLIYFQQGLTDQEVAERTDITVKMANAAGQSAETVSDQMTAVWNNFYDGSKSLEYYADVMTALGAATASSTDEISEGLSKFAAVADTVGLSYEYATAALTTITSNTRESADVVGNALKTLFARIQGLQLGETLDDGTDLNKYSQALEKVGISIYDQNGELKTMDATLTEMAAKWDTLSSTQQVALAQTVAGVRQYTQLVALMENWDTGDADSFMANLSTIEGAEGTLDKQADIYAQSWEAASKRVQTAAEGIYQSLLDDDFFISINNGFANLLGGLDAFIDGAGGVKTVLTGIASIALSTFAGQIPEALDTFKYNLEIVTKGTQTAYDRIQKQMSKATQMAFNEYITSNGEKGIKEDSSTGYAIKQANELTAARNKLALVSDKMSTSEKQMANMSLSLIQQQQEEVVALKQKNEALQESINLQTQSLQTAKVNKTTSTETSSNLTQMRRSYHAQQDRAIEQFDILNEKDINQLTEKDLDKIGVLDDMKTQYQQLTAEIDSFYESYSQVIDNIQSSSQTLGENLLQKWLNPETATAETIEFSQSFQQSLESIQSLLTNTEIDDALRFDTAIEEMKALQDIIPQIVQEVTGLDRAFDKVINSADITEFSTNFEKILEPALKDCKIEVKDFQTILESLYGKSKIQQLSNDAATLAAKEKEAAEKAKILEQNLANFNPGHITRLSEAFSGLVGFLGNTVTAISTVKSMFSNLGDPNLSGWEKFSSFITGLTVLVPTVSSAFSGLSTAVSGATQWLATQNLLVGASTGAFGAQAGSINKATMAEISNYIATAKANGELEEKIIASVSAKLMTEGLAEADAKAAAVAIVHAGGVEFLNGVLTKLGGLLTWIKGHLLLTIGIAAAIVAAIAGIVWIVDALHTSQKEANEAIAEANDKYAEEKQKLDELKDSLKSVQDRITELQAQDSLSLVEQEELNKLLEQEASLQRQIALQEQLAQVAKQNAATTFEQNAKKAGSWMDTAPTSERWATVYDPTQEMYVDKYYDSIEDFKQDIDKMYLDENGNVIAGQEAMYQEYMNQYQNWVNEYQQEQAQWIEANKDSLTELTEGYQNWFDIYGNNPQYAEQMMQYAKLISDANKAIYGDSYDEKVLGSMDNTFEASTDAKDKNVIDTIINDLSDGIMDTHPEKIAAQFSDSFKNSLLKQGILPEDYAKHLIDEYSRIASSLEGTGIALKDLIAGGMSLEDLEILAQIKITGDDDLNSILEKIEAYKNNTIEVGFNLDTWKSDYSSKMDVVNDLETGDFISAEDYAILGDEYSKYFEEWYDGTYRLIGSAQDFKTIVEGIELGKLKEEIADLQGESRAGAKAYGEVVGRDNVTEEYVTNMANQMQSDAEKGNASTWLGTNAEKGMIAATDFDQTLDDFATAEEYIIALTDAWLNLQNTLNDNQGTLAQTIDSFDELNEALNQGTIDAEEASNAIDSVMAAEAEANDLDLDAMYDFAEYLSENADALDEYDDNLKDNLNLCKKVATAQAKLNKAVETAADNWEDWTETLEEGSAADIDKVIEEVNEVLADMLDLTDEAMEGLSDDFALENWDLIEDVINGVEGALEQLQVAAAEDMILNIKPELEGTTALTEMNSLLTELSLMATGAELTAEPDLQIDNALDKMTELLTAAGFTVDEMAAIFSGFGWEPQIDYKEVDVNAYYGQNSSGFQDVAVLQADGSYKIERMDLAGAQALAQDGKIMVPYIKSATKTGGGSGSYTPSSTGSGGGGGGSSSTPSHAEKKNDSDKTRYHTLQNQLEDLTAEYEALADASDRAFGQEKLDNIDKEIAKTDELINKQEEYLDAISHDLPIDKSVMSAYYTDLIGGKIKFDEKGNISNYDEIQDAMFAKYNAMAEAYDEESTEWQVFEEKYEQLEKYIEQYEETYDLLRDEEAEYQELLNQRIDLELEKVTYSVEIALDIPEAQIELLEYQLGRIEDDAFESGESVALLTKQAEQLYDQIQINKQGLNDALELSLSTSEIISLMAGDTSVLNGKTFTEDQIDAIKEYRDNLLDLNEEFDEIRETIEEKVMEVFDAWNEKLENGIEQLEHYGNVLESYQNIIDIVGEDGLGISEEFIKNLNEAQIGNAIDKVNATRDAYEAMMKAQQEAEKALEEAKERGDEASIKMWTENLAELTDEANSAQEEFLSAWEDALDTVAEQFEMTVERVIESFNESIYALGGLEGLSEEFSRQQETADMMVDDYQKIYELSKLNRDIQRTLDDTDVIAGKQKLLKLQEKINDLEAEGVEMSQYDLEYLQAEYELRMAEIELENAQKAKDTVRMSRDNEGNWSYVYTTNTDAVDEAQQKYEDALYAMQDLSSNYIDEMSEKLISTSQEMEEALASLRIQDFASIDDYYAEVERVKKVYLDQMALEQAELQKAVDNNKVLYDTDMTNYAIATGEKYRLAENFMTTFSDTLLANLMGSESETANFTDIIGTAVDDLTTGLMDAATIYYQNLEAAMNAADTSTGDFAEDTAANIDAVVEKSKEGAEAVDQMAIEMTEAFKEITDTITNWQETYGMAMENIIQSNLDVIESFNKMLEALSIDADKINVSYDINTGPEKDNPAAFDTGGYTGKWGDIGKLAVLHEKELILNENDTSNFLKAINISKVILDMIETNARYASMGLGQITPTVVKEETQETLEQIVHITADFSGVKDRNEIEEAFKSLINTSSQYANRK